MLAVTNLDTRNKIIDAAQAARIASSGAFVIPTLVTLSTAFGHSAAALAADERVRSRLGGKWLASLARSSGDRVCRERVEGDVR